MPEIHKNVRGWPAAWKCIIFFVMAVGMAWSCKDKVREFDGFTQKELEHLLASDSVKAWMRILREEDGQEVVPDDCGMDNQLIFMQGDLGDPKRLLYAYDPEICDSLDFCDRHPDFCQADTMLCQADTLFCQALGEGILYIGSWYAKAPFIENTRADTLIFEINNKTEAIWVLDITSQRMKINYKNRKGDSGGEITEYYEYAPFAGN